MNKQKQIKKRRQRRRYHVRKKARGTSQSPRLCVERSLKHIAVQLIDDENARTLASASTRDTDIRAEVKYGGNAEAAVLIGKRIAEKAKAAGIESAKFDRGHSKYHGRVAALADAAREAGLQV